MLEFGLSFSSQFGLFALLTLSLALVFGVSRIPNLAVGDFAALGAYGMVILEPIPFWLRVVVILIVLAPVFYVIERVLLSRVHDLLSGLLVTFGLGLAIRQLMESIFTSTARSVSSPVAGSISFMGTTYPTYRLLIAAITIVITIVTLVVAYRTRGGLNLRAVSDNQEMSALLGTNPERTRGIAFVVASLFAVLAGALYSPLLGVSPSMGFSLLIPGFVAILLVRPGSLRGAVMTVAGIILFQVFLHRIFSAPVADSIFYVVVLCAVVLLSSHPIRKLSSSLKTPIRKTLQRSAA